jgi:putative membrane protein
LLSLDLMPFGMEWMSSLLLAMLGLAAGGWMWLNFAVRGAAISVAIFLLGLGLEYIGVTTGFPFGRYEYTGVLAPSLPGGMPLAIGFAWLLIVVAGFFTTTRAWPGNVTEARSRVLPVQALVAAILAVGLDLLLEPVAYHIKGYWIWLDGNGGYYGVPWANFAAWFAAALVLNLMLGALLPQPDRIGLKWSRVPVALYTMNVLLFSVVNLAHGLWLAGIVGLFILVCLTSLSTRLYHPASRASS